MNLADYLTDAPWKERAACRDMDSRIFFPDRAGPTDGRAKRVCSSCLVKTECLDEALSYAGHYDAGIWGGTTPRERRKLRQRQAA